MAEAISISCGKLPHPRYENPFPCDMPPIKGEIPASCKNAPSDVKAFPCPRDAHFPPRPAHPRGEMLEMAHRVPEESAGAVRRISQHPLKRRVRPWPLLQHRIIFPQIRGERLVELQDRLRRFSRQPMSLRENQCVPIKARAAIAAVGDRFPGRIGRQMGAAFHTAMFVLAPER